MLVMLQEIAGIVLKYDVLIFVLFWMAEWTGFHIGHVFPLSSFTEVPYQRRYASADASSLD
ncbi:hypothetical protein R0J91_20675, partial [Micrococcus sp. SIMBA_131]